jgi:acetoin utilization deacetylase AcuC-like enzyme
VPLTLPVVCSTTSAEHRPDGEYWVGVRISGTEVAERVEVIERALVAAGAPVTSAVPHDDTVLRRVHEPALLEHLAGVHADWVAAGFPREPGQAQVVPYVFPTTGMLGAMPLRQPAAVHARAGHFCYDTMTLVGPGTWPAVRAAVDVALTAADLVLAGVPVAYALCRPPGHHATSAAFGGSCYCNNAAVAATALLDAGHAAVVVLDLDAHHGNGTQEIGWERADLRFGSVHVDPAAGWFPHWVGFADERGAGPGLGATWNRPLPPGTGDVGWTSAVADLATWADTATTSAVVVSLGVDAAADDPESPLLVTAAGYRAAGRLVASLARPTVVVQEGGYHLPSLGPLVVAFLEGLLDAGPA